MNKKSQANLFAVIIWVVSAFVVVMFLGMWIYAHNLITNLLTSIPATGLIDIADAASKTFSLVDTALNSLHFIAVTIIVILALSVLINAIFIRQHPVLLGVHIFMTLVSVTFSAYIANQYEVLLNNAVIGATLEGFRGSSHILLFAPIWCGIIGVLGFIFLLIQINRDPEFKTTKI